MLQFSGIGAFALVALVLCWSLALTLFRVGKIGSVAHRLSLLLLVEGATLISTGYLDLFLSEAATASSWYPMFYRIEVIVHTAGDCLMLALYPPFLAAAIRTRFTAPFASPSVAKALLVMAALLCAVALWGPLKFGGTILYVSLTILFAYALLVSIHAWLTATGVARTRAGIFAVAFGLRDVCWGIVYGWATLLLWQGTYAVVDPNATGVPYLLYILGSFLAVPLIAYGILKTHLFDIDLKIQWTIRQTTVAAAFVAVFYLVTEAADRYLASELGNWVGLIGSATLVFFLAPLQRFAERVASFAMPQTRDTTEYRTFRKFQVYQAALQDALPGGISEKERALLNHLRDSLEIGAQDAAAMESDQSAFVAHAP